MTSWRDDFRALVDELQHSHSIWYEWGGQDLPAGMVDCSGFVIEVLKTIGILPISQYDMTAHGLYRRYCKECDGNDIIMPGDLVFYGRPRVRHVMFFYGDLYHNADLVDTDLVVGMCGGGNRHTNRWISEKFGVGLWLRDILYRSDYVGFGKPTN